MVDEEVRQPEAQDGNPVVPPGTVVPLSQAEHATVHHSGRGGARSTRHEVSAAGAWSMHPADVVREHLVSTGRNDNGCCGSDGMDGPNRQCVCGAVVGTEWSDCWTAAEVRLAPAAVVAQTREA